MNDVNLDRIYFCPGDLCQVRHNVENRPIMWAVEKVVRNIRNKDTDETESMILGIKCRWFDDNKCLQEGIFSTKDLVPYKK